jgi:NAD(P)-dependent dehydrogenase (short-subunit alcohol dehydrogenase family)
MNTLKELMRLDGRRALITGGAGNLGRIIAETLGELGADLILIDRPGCDWGTIKKDIHDRWKCNVQLIECDLESEDQRQEMIESVKTSGRELNILINNAAFVGNSDLKGWAVPFENQSLDTWRRAIELNLTAVFHLCQSFAPDLKAAVDGNIVNIGSIYGEYGPDWRLYDDTTMANPAAYAVSKGGLIQLTRWLATTLAPNVRVNLISPGGILRAQPRIFVKRYADRTPMGRMAHEDDFRGAVAYLSSPMSRYVTGLNLHVNGGWGIW